MKFDTNNLKFINAPLDVQIELATQGKYEKLIDSFYFIGDSQQNLRDILQEIKSDFLEDDDMSFKESVKCAIKLQRLALD